MEWKASFVLVLCGVLMHLVPTTLAAGNSTVFTKPLRVLGVLEPPFMMKDPKTGKLSGFMLDVLEKLAVPIAKIETIDDAPYGMEESPEIWEAVTGNLVEESSDIAIAAFGIRSKHTHAVTFSQAVIYGGYMILYKVPEDWNPKKKAILTLLQPFSSGLWCLIVFMCVVTTAVLYFIRRFSPFENSHTSVRSDNAPTFSLIGAFFYFFSTITFQNHQKAPTSVSGRIVIGAWWVFVLMTSAAYVSSLVVILFREDPHIRTLPFASVDEMLRQSEVGILGVKGSETYNYMAQSTGQLERKIYNMWKANWDTLMVDSVETALELMEKSGGKYGVYMEETAADYLANHEPCNKMIVGEPIGDQAFGFACKRGTTYCDDINSGILHLQETGQMEQLREKWFWSGCQKSLEYFYEGVPFIDTFGGNTDLLTPVTLTITRFSAAFIVLAIGVCIAFVIMVFEILYDSKRGKFPLLSGRQSGHDDHRIQDGDYTAPNDS